MGHLTIFSDAQAQLSKYWYERVPYTVAVPTLTAATPVPLFAATRLSGAIPLWRTHLVDLAGTQNANVTLTINADTTQYGGTAATGNTAALRASLQPDTRIDLPALKQLSGRLLPAANKTTATLVNYTIARHRLTAAEKLLLFGDQATSKLTPEEQKALAFGRGTNEALHVGAGVKKGTGPIPWIAQMERTYENRLIAAETQWIYASEATTADQPIGNPLFPGPDEFLVLRELSVEPDPATGALPDAVISVNRDHDVNYFGLQATNAAGPWDIFIPALDEISLHAQMNSGTGNIAVRVVVWRVQFSDLLKVRFGLVHPGEVPDRTYYGALAGVM